MTIKNENQIYSDVISIINKFLTANNFQWQVLQLNQPVNLTEIKPTIWVSITNPTQRGWQYTKYKGFQEQEEFKRSQNYKEEFIVQFSALRNRLLTDDVNTLNSIDILKYLKMYLLDRDTGQKEIRMNGYSTYQPTPIQNPTFDNDSDNIEFMPFFQLTFIVEQSLENKQEKINEFRFKEIKGV